MTKEYYDLCQRDLTETNIKLGVLEELVSTAPGYYDVHRPANFTMYSGGQPHSRTMRMLWRRHQKLRKELKVKQEYEIQ